MRALNIAVSVVWIAFWLYWLLAAVGAKRGRRTRRIRPVAVLIILAGGALTRLTNPGRIAVHGDVAKALGVVLLVSGLGLAVWARVHIGRNWGMPMTQKDEPELVTSGPYAVIRHPIYSGILLGVLGTALAENVTWLIVLAVVGAYFAYSAVVEERQLAADFPEAYAAYRARTKMLIPFVL